MIDSSQTPERDSPDIGAPTTAATVARGGSFAAVSSDVDDRARRLRRLDRLARALDTAFRIPGTKIEFGFDSIIGLLPAVGDSATALVSLYFVYEAWRMNIGNWRIAQMLLNILIDLILGSVPVLGDAVDVFWKANRRNLEIIRKAIS